MMLLAMFMLMLMMLLLLFVDGVDGDVCVGVNVVVVGVCVVCVDAFGVDGDVIIVRCCR